jgi:hypothetical protein
MKCGRAIAWDRAGATGIESEKAEPAMLRV